jgi:hypothetical protein
VCSDAAYHVLITVQFLWLFGFALYYGLRIVEEREQRDAVQYPWQPTDVVWTRSNLMFYSRWCFLAGVVSSELEEAWCSVHSC